MRGCSARSVSASTAKQQHVHVLRCGVTMTVPKQAAPVSSSRMLSQRLSSWIGHHARLLCSMCACKHNTTAAFARVKV
jgi:hypothetical protein